MFSCIIQRLSNLIIYITIVFKSHPCFLLYFCSNSLHLKIITNLKIYFFRTRMVKFVQKWVCDHWAIGKNFYRRSSVQVNQI